MRQEAVGQLPGAKYKIFVLSYNPPSATSAADVTLNQQQLQAGSSPQWEFIRQPGHTHRVRLRDTEMHVAFSAATTNSDIVLLPRRESDGQLWRLVKQRLWF